MPSIPTDPKSHLERFHRESAQLFVLFLLALFFSGCVYSGESLYQNEILRKDVRSWSIPECNRVIATSMANNLRDPNSTIVVFALPCLPHVLTAYNRMKQLQEHWTNDEFIENLDRQARNCAGLAYDGAKRLFYDSHGNIYHTPLQLDSLLFIVTLEYPNAFNSTSVNAQELSRQIYLEDSHHLMLMPASVRAEKGNALFSTITYIVIFHFGTENRYFDNSFAHGADLVITGLPEPLRLRIEAPEPDGANQ